MGVPMGWDCREDGVFDGCDEMSENWTSENYYSYLVYNGKYPIGFALIKKHFNNVINFEVEEFFILRKYRRKNLGKNVSFELFDKYKGKWQVKVLQDNLPAQKFWKNIIQEYTHNKFQEKQIIHECPYSGTWHMIMYRFES